jgi:hypothetical protein
LYSHACFHMQVISIVLNNGVGIFCTTVLCDKDWILMDSAFFLNLYCL